MEKTVLRVRYAKGATTYYVCESAEQAENIRFFVGMFYKGEVEIISQMEHGQDTQKALGNIYTLQ